MSSDRPADPSHDQPTDQLVIGGPDAPKNHKGWWIGGGVAAVLALGGGAAAWALTSFLSTGAQPAEALPASTIGYVSVDLDPSGGQKIEALKLARKFPAFKDKVGLDTGDDVRKWIVEQIRKESDCDLDFAQDVEPWLGSRMAVAAVGTDKPFPVFVLQTTDGAKADGGLKKIAACDPATTIQWRTEGDWTVVAETKEQVDEVVADAGKGSLADDSDFRSWTDKTGDSGILTAYAAPGAGAAIARELEGSDATGGDGMSSELSPFGGLSGSCPGAGAAGSAESAKAKLADFGGAAATLRFSDSGVELAFVGDAAALTGGLPQAGRTSDPVVSTLPADTALAVGGSLPKGWTGNLTQGLQQTCGPDADPAEIFGPLSQMSGLDLPGDLEKLFGDSAALALGPGLDAEKLVNSGDWTALPIALKVRGDEATVEKVAGKLREGLGTPSGVLEPKAGDGAVALGLDPAFVAQVAEKGKLGSDATYTGVVPQADRAASVLYVNFDRFDDLASSMAGGDQQLVSNLEPLRALGVSSWLEDGDTHGLLRVTVD